MKHIPKSIRNSSIFKDGLLWLRKSRINRKDRVPVLTVMQFLYKKLARNNVHQQASAIAFSFMLSLFPAILFFISLVPYIAAQLQIPNLLEQVLDILRQGVPQGIYEFIEPTISDIIQNKSVGLLSFGFIFAVYAATSGVVELMHTFNLNYAYSEKRSFIKKRLVAIWLAFLFAFMLIFAVVVLIVGELVVDMAIEYSLMNENLVFYIILILRYLLAFLVFYICISYIYYVAPANPNQWHFFSYGSTASSVLIILITYLFSFYLSNFANYNKLYGSIGTLIALMLWLYLLSWVLLLGFSLNASIGEARVAHRKEMEVKFSLLDQVEDFGSEQSDQSE